LVNIGDVVKGGRTILAELPTGLAAVAEEQQAKINRPESFDDEPAEITNEGHQQELPLVIDHPEVEEPAKPAKKAAPTKKATPAKKAPAKPKGDA
jgi:phosphatidylserine decarboxylase